MNVSALLIIPLFLALLSALSPWFLLTDTANIAGYVLYIATAVLAIHGHFQGLELEGLSPLFHIDSLSLLLLLVLAVVGLAGALYSPSFIKRDIRQHSLRPFKYRKYFGLYNLLFFAMTLLALSDNIGIIWVAIEATTLISALLVSFDNRKEPVEAAWRYLLICSIGIAFALLGTILTYYASSISAGPGTSSSEGSLSWQLLVSRAHELNPNSMKLAFLFLLFGYGTKAGLVPMARWKPRTYGEAPSSVSAIMSGALVACSVYILARFSILSAAVLGAATVSNYLVFFGAISILFSTPMIIAETDMKRLFAYSSIEHVGIITVGLGFGTFFGIYGALLHVINNAFIKTAMYFCAGNVISSSGQKDVRRLSCAIRLMPLATIGLLSTIVATTATPPFALFLSEFNILKGGITSSHYWVVAVISLSLFLIFAALYTKFLGLAFGSETQVKIEKTPLIQNAVPMILLALVLIMGFFIPSPIHRLLVESSALFGVKP